MTTPDPDEMERRLEELEERTEAVRRQAQEHGTLPDPHHGQTFIDPDADGETADQDEHPGEVFGT